jgi:hypothetical protein
MKNLVALLSASIVIVGSGLAQAQSTRPAAATSAMDDLCPYEGSCFQTGWIPVSNQASHTITVVHPLGAVPRLFSIYFSPNADGSFAMPLTWSFFVSNANSGNPVSSGVTSGEFLLEIWSGTALHAYWNASTGQWTSQDKGYFRIFAKR